VVRLEKVFVAAIVDQVRGLSSDDVGLRLLARRARLKIVRDMLECK